MEIVLVIVAVAAFIYATLGNGVLIYSLITQNFESYEDNVSALVFTIIVDIIIGVIILIMFGEEIEKSNRKLINSLNLARKEILNFISKIKIKKETKENEKEIYAIIEQLKKLRNANIDPIKVERANTFYQLIQFMDYNVQISGCEKALKEKYDILESVKNLEKELIEKAEIYKQKGNIDKYIYCCSFVDQNQSFGYTNRLRNECLEYAAQRREERKAFKKWRNVILILLSILLAISIIRTINNIPYWQLHNEIKNQTLTREMCDYSNRENENSYYQYLEEDKGLKVICKELSNYHKKNDIESALWLICVQPDCINGYDMCASEEFMEWIMECAKNNGIKDGNNGFDTYFIGDYQIELYSDDYILVSNDKNSSSVEGRNDAWEDDVITIK